MDTEHLTDGLTDHEVWTLELRPYTSATVIARKLDLIAEAATWLQPRIKRCTRRIARTQKRIEAYLSTLDV